jgi:hypothetical protein
MPGMSIEGMISAADSIARFGSRSITALQVDIRPAPRPDLCHRTELFLPLRFTLRQLEYFAALGEGGGVAAAARFVHARKRHAAILARLGGTPSLPIEYEGHKASGVFAYLAPTMVVPRVHDDFSAQLATSLRGYVGGGLPPDERLAIARLLADDQRHMLAQVSGGAVGDDFGILGGRDGQAGAGHDLERTGCSIGGEICCRDWHRLSRRFGIDQKRRQDSGDSRQFQRGAGGFLPVERHRFERAFQRIAQIQRRIGYRQGIAQGESLAARDQHRSVGYGGLALVGELQGGGARGGDQHLRGARPAGDGGFDREQNWPAVERQRPAMAQRVHGLSGAA